MLLLLVGIAAFGAVRKSRAPIGPERPACITVAMTPDSVFITLAALPCPQLGIDTVMVIRMPSQHRTCSGQIEIDALDHSATPTWADCKRPAVWFNRLPIQRAAL